MMYSIGVVYISCESFLASVSRSDASMLIVGIEMVGCILASAGMRFTVLK
jgi:hypothetical protein